MLMTELINAIIKGVGGHPTLITVSCWDLAMSHQLSPVQGKEGLLLCPLASSLLYAVNMSMG